MNLPRPKPRAAVTGFVLALAGCGVMPPGGPRLAQEQPAASGKATVYLYNPPSQLGALGCGRFAVGSAAPAPLPNGSYARFDLSPGTYRIKAETSWCFAVPVSGAVILGAGDTVFVKLQRIRGYAPGYTRLPGAPGDWLGLEVVPEIVARQEMAELGKSNAD